MNYEWTDGVAEVCSTRKTSISISEKCSELYLHWRRVGLRLGVENFKDASLCCSLYEGKVVCILHNILTSIFLCIIIFKIHVYWFYDALNLKMVNHLLFEDDLLVFPLIMNPPSD